MIANGFDDVRIVAGTGDRGGDVLGVQDRQLWIFQCKYTSRTPPPVDGIREVVEAGKFYKGDRLVVATSRPAGDAFNQERARYARLGLNVEYAGPWELLQLMQSAPEYSKHRKILHSYQESTSQRFREALLDTGRAQIVLATGLGKTVVMAETVADLLRDATIRNGRVLVLAHVRELVSQLHQSFWYQLPKWVATHQLSEGEFPTFWDGVTFATVQSVCSRLDQLPHFDLVLIDEAHHVGAQTFRDVIAKLKPTMLGGVTATPWRGDGYDIDQLLGPPLVRIGIAEGLQKGFLSEVDYRLFGDNLDWHFVQSESRFKYALSELNKKLIIPTRDEEAARIIREVFTVEKRRTGIIYSPTTIHADAFCAMLRLYGLKAQPISYETPVRERDILMSRFRAGQLDIVATVDLFNEGVDVPDVDFIAFMRATHSRRIFVQQLGRGLRISRNKNKVVVLDFVTDLRRMAEVLDLDRSVRGSDVERLGLGGRLVQFHDKSAGSFLQEWLLDQASLFVREDDPTLELPRFNFPEPPPPGGIQ
jgi:superfamily II DNA or RNA helicase